MNKSTYPDWLSHLDQFEVVYKLRSGVVNTPATSVTEQEIQAAEREIGNKFPVDYRLFLSKYCDAYFRMCSSTLGPHPGVFFGVRSNSFTSLVEEWRSLGDEFPARLVPICDDAANGGILCVSVAAPDRGTINWILRGDTTIKMIARDFSSFVSTLYLDDR